MRPVGLTSNAWTNGFGESCAAIVSNNASAGSPSLDSSSTWALRRRSPIAWLLPAKAGGVSRWPARYIRRCRRTGSHPRVSHLWSTSITRDNIEETAVYDKYVRWCGRTGPRGPSYPIRSNFSHLLSLSAGTVSPSSLIPALTLGAMWLVTSLFVGSLVLFNSHHTLL